ncbi:hypothetical protein K4F52_002594 [Lecanicillium sp. MT-2017a]|nr:hypothetical protein K4F52_002594 [Lecanicillium sp. MT-2017a]
MYIRNNTHPVRQLVRRLPEVLDPKEMLKKPGNVMCLVLISLMGLVAMFWVDCKPRKRNSHGKGSSQVPWPSDSLAGYREKIYNILRRPEAYRIPDEPLTELEPCVFKN